MPRIAGRISLSLFNDMIWWESLSKIMQNASDAGGTGQKRRCPRKVSAKGMRGVRQPLTGRVFPKGFLLSFKSSLANGWIGEQVFLNVEQPHLISSPLPDYVKRLLFFKTFFQLI
ncbi:hypothetical protein [Lelliottia nimipressuralis]|uniref:hypothetical protein n=1 Tax=Lelliottia nimipressuralis TaxID=69220 RepID=UPI001E32CAF9|nr:hypothetical protein [Lelliottia nimipressuralis]MCD4559995.1 hypothetical protein [Lelliottia nimipressuralis]